jgi:hypothetical protein
MKIPFLCFITAVLVAFLRLTASAETLILSDTFAGASNGAALADYNLMSQKGTMAPLPYVMRGSSRGTSPITTIHNPDSQNVVVRTHMLHGDNAGVLAFGLERPIVAYSTLIIDFAMRRNNAIWSSVVIGSDTPASQLGNDLFTLRLLNDGAIQVKPRGSGENDPTLNYRAFIVNGNDSFTAFRLEIEADGWDGRGDVVIRAFYNNEPKVEAMWRQLDLGGPNGSLVRPTFRSNYISFSSQHPDRNSTAFYRDISIRTKDLR